MADVPPEVAIRMTVDGKTISSKTMILTMFSDVAQDWFEDALFAGDLQTQGDVHARRHEILFSACCAESYLVEWARRVLQARKVAHRELFAKLESYFPTGRKGPRRPEAAQLWVIVPRRLYEDGYLQSPPGAYSAQQRADFERLIVFRNDITHAELSRPLVLGPASEQPARPRTTTPDLVSLPAGWAVRVVAERIQELHTNIGSDAPRWARVPTGIPDPRGVSKK